MAGRKAFVFDAQDIYDLLVHYTDGGVPLNGRILQVGAHPMMNRTIGLLVESHEWPENDPAPFHVRYEGKLTASWSNDHPTDTPGWLETPDAPKLQ